MADKKEYIERGALLMTPPFTKFGGDSTWYTEGYLDCADEARKAVNDAPAADVVEVKQGEIIETIIDGKMNRVFSCCGKDFTQLTQWIIPNYCPNCGAKMDGERKDIP